MLVVVNFARQVPHGLLLFFPSYPVMQKCIEHWQVFTISPSISLSLTIGCSKKVLPKVKNWRNEDILQWSGKIRKPGKSEAKKWKKGLIKVVVVVVVVIVVVL